VNDQFQTETSSALVWALLTFVAPLALFSGYLMLSRWPARVFAETSDFAAMFLSAIPGCWPIMRLPFPILAKLALCVGYLAIVGVVFFFYALFFVCAVFRDCL
jgi:hypothetical protein